MSLIIISLLIYFVIIIWFILGIRKNSAVLNNKIRSLSVIVSVHNEENNIESCLQSLVNQDFPAENFEIIVINDRSTDRTEEIIVKWAKKYKNIKSLNIKFTPPGIFSKKHALNEGIKLSSSDILCFTDADCLPGPNWLQGIVSVFHSDSSMVVGLAPLFPCNSSKPPFWQRFLAYESWINGFSIIASVQNNFPLTCAGRNLAYSKSEFNKIGGFSRINHSLSGDDDLLMFQFEQKSTKRIKALTDPDSLVISGTVKNLRQLWFQKTRHFSAGRYYPIDKKLFYTVWQSCSLLLIVAPILAIFVQWLSIWFSLVLLLVKFSVDFIYHFIGFKKYKILSQLRYFILFEFVYNFYILFFGFAGLIKKPVWSSDK